MEEFDPTKFRVKDVPITETGFDPSKFKIKEDQKIIDNKVNYWSDDIFEIQEKLNLPQPPFISTYDNSASKFETKAALAYGWNSAVSSSMHLLAGVPGWIDRFADNTVEFFGGDADKWAYNYLYGDDFAQDNNIISYNEIEKAGTKLKEKKQFREQLEKNPLKKYTHMALAQIDGFEEFFKEQAIKRHPENVESAFYEPGFRPEGVYEKFMAIAGGSPITLPTVAGAVAVTRNPMAGFALLGFLESYDQPMSKVIYNTAVSALEGYAFQGIVNSGLNWKKQAAAFAALGAGASMAHGGGFDDTVASALAMPIFAAPILAGTYRATGFKKDKPEIDPKLEAETNPMGLVKSADAIMEIKARTDASRQNVKEFVEDKLRSGYTVEKTNPVDVLDIKTGKAKPKEFGYIEKLEATKQTQKDIDAGKDKITFEKLTEESKPENRIVSTQESVKIKEDGSFDVIKDGFSKIEKVETKVDRDAVIFNGKYLDISLRLDGNGKVVGKATPPDRIRLDDPSKAAIDAKAFENLDPKITEGANFESLAATLNTRSFGERYGFIIGKNGDAIARLSELIKLKKDISTRKKENKWLDAAIKDGTEIKKTFDQGLDKRVKETNKNLENVAEHLDTYLYSVHNLNPAIGLSPFRTINALEYNLFTKNKDGSFDVKVDAKGNKVEKDFAETDLNTFVGQLKDKVSLLEVYGLAPQFIGSPRTSRVMKTVMAEVERTFASVEKISNLIMYRPKTEYNPKKVDESQYIFEDGGLNFGIKTLIGNANSKIEPLRSVKGALTEFEALAREGRSGLNSMRKIVDARIDRDAIMYEKAIKAAKETDAKSITREVVEKEYLSKNADGTLKYQMSYPEMQKIFKLSDKEIKIVEKMDVGLKQVLEIYNNAVLRFPQQGFKPIEPRPNYDIRGWYGAERAFIITEKAMTLKGIELPANTTVATIPGNTRAELKSFMREFLRDNPQYNNKKNFKIKYVRKDREAENSGINIMDAFVEAHKIYNYLDPNIVKAIARAEKEMRSKKAIFTAPVKRKNVEGFAGTRGGVQGVTDYLNAYSSYVQGGVRASQFMKFKENIELPLFVSPQGKKFRDNFPNQVKVAEMFMNQAFGRNEGMMAKAIDKVVDGVSDVFRSTPILGSRVPDIFRSINNLTLIKSLLLFNVRFMYAQIVQPFQVILPKLEALKVEHKIPGNSSKAIVDGMFETFFPSPQFQKLLKFAFDNNLTIDAKFLKEFGLDLKTMKRVRPPSKRLMSSMYRFAKGETISGMMERHSRLQAVAMFYHFLKSAKYDQRPDIARREPHHTVKDQRFFEDVLDLADKLMVQYDYKNRAFLYGNQGLGQLGPLAGIFKTFQHNFFGKMSEYVKLAMREKTFEASRPAMYAFLSMIMTAGAFGIMGIEQMDAIVRTINSTLNKFKKKQENVITPPSEFFLKADLPYSFKFGFPSYAVGGDLSSTLQAPQFGLNDLFSLPSLEFFTGLRSGNHMGVIGETYNILSKKMGSMFGGPEVSDADLYMYLKTMMPPIAQAEIDRRFGITGTGESGLPLSVIFNLKDPMQSLNINVDNVYYQKDGPKFAIKNPYKQMRADIRRDATGFFYKYLGGKSFEESILLRAIYQTTKVSKKIKDLTAVHVTSGALEMGRGNYEATMYHVDSLMNLGYTYDQAMEKMVNKLRTMSNTILDRVKGLDKSQNIHLNNFLLDVINNNSISDSYLPGSAYK